MDRKQERKSICTTYDDSNGCSQPSRFHSTGTAAERKQRHLYCIYIYIPGRMAGQTCFICTTSNILRHCHVTFLVYMCSLFPDLQAMRYTAPHDLLPPRAMLGASVRARSHGGVKITLPMSVPLPSREQPRRHERQPIRLHPLGARYQRYARASKQACVWYSRGAKVSCTASHLLRYAFKAIWKCCRGRAPARRYIL